ncbi:MAG: hypothetical protein JNL83_22110 [Myxococcales bacterium]|nr:hypothetical protein [Myxococcales bacterium]
MRCFVLASVVVLGACGGAQIPQHTGYKNNQNKPWKKPKAIVLDEKAEGKVEGDLSYKDYKRARWFSVDVPANGELALKLEVTPPGDEANEEFDLAMEVLDPGYRVISKADLEEEDAHELNKTRTLYDLTPGKYLVHLYLQGRMDSAEFTLRAAYKRAAAEDVKSDFPQHVAFVPDLPMVPVNDDTPKNFKSEKVQAAKIKRPTGPRTPTTPKEPKEPKGPPPTAKTARVIGLSVVSGGTLITIGIGTAHEVAAGWKLKIAGVQGGFTVGECSERSCKATVTATPDQIKAGGGNVTLTP